MERSQLNEALSVYSSWHRGGVFQETPGRLPKSGKSTTVAVVVFPDFDTDQCDIAVGDLYLLLFVCTHTQFPRFFFEWFFLCCAATWFINTIIIRSVCAAVVVFEYLFILSPTRRNRKDLSSFLVLLGLRDKLLTNINQIKLNCFIWVYYEILV